MAFEIMRLATLVRPKVMVNARLFRTADGKRLVPDGHPDAAFLFCTPGLEVDAEEFDSFELVEGPPEVPTETVKAEPQPEDKAMHSPPEDKGADLPAPTEKGQARRKRRKR